MPVKSKMNSQLVPEASNNKDVVDNRDADKISKYIVKSKSTSSRLNNDHETILMKTQEAG